LTLSRKTIAGRSALESQKTKVCVYIQEPAMSITFVLALLALVVALVNAFSGKAPLWIAVALLALAMLVPGVAVR
jgi:hypothetical protein